MRRAPTPDSTPRAAPASPSHTVRYSIIALCYLLTTAFTGAFFQGDTVDYAASVLSGADFWDFGHLLWRPAGWLSYHSLGLPVRALTGATDRNCAILILFALNWLAGLGCCLLLYACLRQCRARTETSVWVLALFLWSQAFLNYAHTGNAYVCGLCLLLLALWLRLKHPGSPRGACGAGLALAGAVLLWLQYLWAVPAIACAPLFLEPDHNSRYRRATAQALATFALCTFLTYSGIAMALHLTQPAAVLAWAQASSHGVRPAPSITRTIFGFARSFTSMGDDAILFKRFLLHDPYNPVTLAQLFRISLWKVVLFYEFAISVVVTLARSPRGRRVLSLLALNALPVLAFASLWQGSDMERYLPLYPLFCIAIAYALDTPGPHRWLKWTTCGFLIVLILSNLQTLAEPSLWRAQAAGADRLGPLQPWLKPTSIEVVVDVGDKIINFNRSFPLHPVNRDNRYHLRVLLERGTGQSQRWRQSFAALVLSTWRRGGDVWITKRVLSSRPQAGWTWTEGAEPGLSWKDIPALFRRLELTQPVGGEDGFVLLPDTARNRAVLMRVDQHRNA